MRSAAMLGQPLPRLGPLLSPTEAERSAVPSSLLSSVEASRCRPSAPGTWAARAARHPDAVLANGNRQDSRQVAGLQEGYPHCKGGMYPHCRLQG